MGKTLGRLTWQYQLRIKAHSPYNANISNLENACICAREDTQKSINGTVAHSVYVYSCNGFSATFFIMDKPQILHKQNTGSIQASLVLSLATVKSPLPQSGRPGDEQIDREQEEQGPLKDRMKLKFLMQFFIIIFNFSFVKPLHIITPFLKLGF